MEHFAMHKPSKIHPSLLPKISDKLCCGNVDSAVFFYHGDHLGSASWITNDSGNPVQHLQYMPYGEPFVNERTSSYEERYTFIGKERDSETGFSYFGARYYDSDLMTGWLSVDPMADKYPNISPYAYCAWNPIRLVDPDGKEISASDDWYEDEKGHVHWDANVHSQADLKNGEIYIGRTTLMTAEGDDRVIYGDQYGRTHSFVSLPNVTISDKRPASNNQKGPAWVDDVSLGVTLTTSMVGWSSDHAYTDYVPLKEANIAKGFNTASKIVQNTGRIAGVAGVIYTGLMASSDGQLSAGEGLRIGLQGLAVATSLIPVYGTAISLGLTAVDFFLGDRIETINFQIKKL